jgi:hypothetical protein
MRQKKNACRIMVGKTERKRPLGRYDQRWRKLLVMRSEDVEENYTTKSYTIFTMH